MTKNVDVITKNAAVQIIDEEIFVTLNGQLYSDTFDHRSMKVEEITHLGIDADGLVSVFVEEPEYCPEDDYELWDIKTLNHKKGSSDYYTLPNVRIDVEDASEELYLVNGNAIGVFYDPETKDVVMSFYGEQMRWHDPSMANLTEVNVVYADGTVYLFHKDGYEMSSYDCKHTEDHDSFLIQAGVFKIRKVEESNAVSLPVSVKDRTLKFSGNTFLINPNHNYFAVDDEFEVSTFKNCPVAFSVQGKTGFIDIKDLNGAENKGPLNDNGYARFTTVFKIEWYGE